MKLDRLALPLIALAIGVPAQAAGPVTGRYVTEDGKAVVEVKRCGNTICGHVSRILAPTPDGPPKDENNPDQSLRDRPVLGLRILSGFRDTGSKWEGRIYSPEEGKTYRSEITRSRSGDLNVKGCVLFFCKTQVWKAVR